MMLLIDMSSQTSVSGNQDVICSLDRNLIQTSVDLTNTIEAGPITEEGHRNIHNITTQAEAMCYCCALKNC